MPHPAAMTDEGVPSSMTGHLVGTACKPTPRWAAELHAEHQALNENLKEYMTGFLEQAILRSSQERRQEQDSRTFWQNRMMLELGKTFKASCEAGNQMASLLGQVQKLAQAVERQQPLLEATKEAFEAMPQQVQNLTRVVERLQQTEVKTLASKLVPLQPTHGGNTAEQQQLSQSTLQIALVKALNKSLVVSEGRIVDRLDELQRMHLARFDAIQDDTRLDTVLKELQTVGARLDYQDATVHKGFNKGDLSGTQSTLSMGELVCHVGDPLVELGKCPSMADMPTSKPTTQPSQTSINSFKAEPVVVKSRGSIMSSSRQIEGFASSKQGETEDQEDGQLRDLFDDGPVETPVEKCLRYVNYISFLLVTFNALYMGIQVDVIFSAVQQNKEEPRYLAIIDHMFTASFVIEICLRLALEKRDFFSGVNARWNLFDTIIIAVQLFEAMQIHDLRNADLVRIIRIVRIIRTARALRTLETLRILRLVMAPEVWQPLFWGVALLLVIVYLFAAFITTLVMDHVKDGKVQPDRVFELYGSVGRTQYTLFMAVSGGEAWASLLAPLEAISEWYCWLFAMYMIIVLFGATNTVSAVYVDALLHFSSRDREIIMTERNATEKFHLRQLRMMLKSQPLKDGLIEQQHFLNVLRGEGANQLKFLGLQFPVARALFRLLDVEDVGAVEVDEYIYGLLHLKGNATTIHMATLMYQSKRLLFKIQRVTALVEDRVMPLLQGTDVHLHVV